MVWAQGRRKDWAPSLEFISASRSAMLGFPIEDLSTAGSSDSETSESSIGLRCESCSGQVAPRRFALLAFVSILPTLCKF